MLLSTAMVDPVADPHFEPPAVGHAMEDEIRTAAYFKYLERNGACGDELGDWLAAEGELRSRPVCRTVAGAPPATGGSGENAAPAGDARRIAPIKRARADLAIAR